VHLVGQKQARGRQHIGGEHLLSQAHKLPFGLLVDKWRWGVFNGSIAPANYNKAWTDLRRQYQGIVPPAERPANAFDPGAKYHIPGNTPYTRYVLARILQGVSMGGEYGASATYLSEMASRDRRGFWSGIFYSTLMSGQLLALLLLLALTSVLPPDQMNAWGWRVAFIVGALMATAVLFMRRGMEETPSFKARDGSRTATWRLVTDHPRETLMVFGLTAGGTLAYYTFGT
jgi:MFS family permease